MKKLPFRLLGLSLALFGILFLTGAFTSSNNAAMVINGAGCGLADGDGNFLVTTNTHQVITNSANGNHVFKCKADVPNSTGKAVHYNNANTGALCGTSSGLTSDWSETVSASGKATLTCRYKN